MITLFRVDDRLIHGQVQTKWLSTVSANKVIIVDEKTSRDPIALQILKIAAPNNISLEVYNEVNGAARLKDEENSPNKAAVLFKSITTVRSMLDKGVNIKELIIGPCSAKPNAKMMVKNTYFLPEEIEAAAYISGKNTRICFQLVPEDPKDDWTSVSKKMK